MNSEILPWPLALSTRFLIRDRTMSWFQKVILKFKSLGRYGIMNSQL